MLRARWKERAWAILRGAPALPADMLRLQQAYQAASQLISTADNMFQTILGAVSR